MVRILSFLVVTYVAQTSLALPSVPHPLRASKVERAMVALLTATEKKSSLLSMLALARGGDLPAVIGDVFEFEHLSMNGEDIGYARSVNDIRVLNYLEEASFAELDGIISLLGVEVERVLPQIGSLTEEEFNRHVNVVRAVVHLSAGGYAGVISGFQVLYAEEKLAEMHKISLAVWEKHYRAFSDAQLKDELFAMFVLREGVWKEKAAKMAKMAEVGMPKAEEWSERLKARIKLAGAETAELLYKLHSASGERGEIIAHLARKRVPPGIFLAVRFDDAIETKNLTAVEEINLVENILLSVHGLNPGELRYLDRQLKLAAHK